MREIGNNLDIIKQKVKSLYDMPVAIKISTGKGKHVLCNGRIVSMFPKVFCVKMDNGEMRTFSYSDVHTKSVILIDATKKTP